VIDPFVLLAHMPSLIGSRSNRVLTAPTDLIADVIRHEDVRTGTPVGARAAMKPR